VNFQFFGFIVTGQRFPTTLKPLNAEGNLYFTCYAASVSFCFIFINLFKKNFFVDLRMEEQFFEILTHT